MTGVSAGCETAADRAESATLHAFLNCYLRETDAGEIVGSKQALSDAASEGDAVRILLPQQQFELIVPLRYESPTGRHLFELPAYGRAAGGEPKPIDAGTVATLCRRELALSADTTTLTEGTDLLRRLFASRQAIERFVSARDDACRATDEPILFQEAEQSLIYGHHLHPTPKSREGIADHEAPTYAPELNGSFQLRYFAADPDLVSQWSTDERHATDWLLLGLDEAPTELPARAERAVDNGRLLIPTHPWQASYLISQPHVEGVLDEGRLTDLGAFGPTFYPTTSVRTLWSPEAPFMVKTSLAVQITNAERTGKIPELKLGVAAAELLDTGFGDRITDRFPQFSILRDPAALTLDVGDGPESGFETVLRENPFRDEAAANVSPVVALCQDGINGPSRLARLVSDIADRTGRSTSGIAREWFREYLAVLLKPVIWMYLELGVGLEAHQQNTLIRLDIDGWPVEGFYRDNEGFYLPESRCEEIEGWLPGITDRVDTVCPDSIADECIRYYTVINNAFGVINALGVAGLVDETTLLKSLRSAIADLAEHEPAASSFATALLEESHIPAKGNLRTRFEGRDELAAPLEEESVYISVENPLVTRLSESRD
ncbi:IucA/IucC family siderophore biosynthesis protein [Haloarcula sp. CBA1127]|uniref:IucA/IucC family protein n=1 Tax=Haloarcula sp. CBA1127 TaxID=1765055 RepID=UPI00073E4F30|nr:IucA/IucC family protein [Haloarcula sp. CBA1127]